MNRRAFIKKAAGAAAVVAAAPIVPLPTESTFLVYAQSFAYSRGRMRPSGNWYRVAVSKESYQSGGPLTVIGEARLVFREQFPGCLFPSQELVSKASQEKACLWIQEFDPVKQAFV